MKSYLAIALALCLGVLLSDDRTFPSDGGDLASSVDWDGAVPGVEDKVIVDKAGDYTLLGDVTFNSFNAMKGGCRFDFSGGKMTLGKKGDGALYCKPNGGGRTVFSGGKFVFSNHGRCFPYVAPDSAGIVEFTGGCIITNADYFSGTRSTSGGRVEITGGTMVFVTNRFAVLQGDGSGNTVKIGGGAKVFATGNVYSEFGADNKVPFGGNELVVTGEGSLFSKDSGKDFVVGYETAGNRLSVVDGGECSITGKGGLAVRTSFNEILVSNAVFNCATAFCLAQNSTSSCNVFRVAGPGIAQNSVSLPVIGNWLVSGHHNLIAFEGGAKWKKGSANAFFTNTHHSVFRVTGAGTQFGDTGYNFYLGSNDGSLTPACADNAVEVLDGATFNARRFALMGIRNMLVVSNATLNIAKKNDDVALRIGYKNGNLVPDNCVLCLKGASPKINVDVGASTNACWVQNNSAIRFEIPKEGYARNHVPVSLGGKFLFDSGCRLEIDCEDFARAGGGKLTLIEIGYNITEETKNALNEGVSGLPDGCQIKISDRSVKLYCPRGLTISIR